MNINTLENRDFITILTPDYNRMFCLFWYNEVEHTVEGEADDNP